MAIKATLSTTYVDAPEDVYNAKGYADQAAASATAAATSATAASTSETNAKSSETAAATSATAASTSETNAKSSETAAATSATAASTSESNAETYAAQAAASATSAASSATASANSAATLTYATADEAEAGTADNRIISPSTLKATLDVLTSSILEKIYPVGSIYISLTSSTSPADILGFGTWEALPAGYGLVAQGTATAEDGTTLTFTAGEKSGEFKHQLTVGEMPTQSPYSLQSAYTTNAVNPTQRWSVTAVQVPNSDEYSNQYIWSPIEGAGGQYHNNVCPSIPAYLWQRTV